MKILWGKAPEAVISFLRRPRNGTVLLVTSKGIYLQVQQRILLLCPQVWGVVPIGISLGEYDAVMTLRPEQPVRIGGGTLTFPGGDVKLELIQAEPVSPHMLPGIDLHAAAMALDGLNKQTGLAPLVKPLLLGKPLEASNPYCQAAMPKLTDLLAGLRQENQERISEAVEQLLGLGTGLTPSGDDVLCGMLYVLLRSKMKNAPALSVLVDTVKKEAHNRTNAISAAYLIAMADGGDYERMAAVWMDLAVGNRDRIGLLTEIGSNSGSEMLLGMLLAEKLLCQRLSRE